MLPVEFLTIPDRIIIVMDKPQGALRAGDIRELMLERDPGKAAPTVGAIRATLSRHPGFRRVARGLWERAQ